MLKVQSRVVVADNTGAKIAEIIGIKKGTGADTATVGDIVTLAIKTAAPTSAVKKGETAKGIVVRTRKEIGRRDGTYIRFGDNAVVLLSVNDKGDMAPIGKRVFGPVAREIRAIDRVITNMSEEVV